MKLNNFSARALLLCLLTVLFTLSCGGKKQRLIKTDGSIKEHYNIVLLLDLSSPRLRIKGQKERDIELIKYTIQLFENRQAKFGYISSKDKLHIVPTPTIGLSANALYTINMDGKNKPKFDLDKKQILYMVNRIYSKAGSNSFYSDIWSFMNYNLSDYISSSTEQESYVNKLVVLSDGYMTFEEDVLKKRFKNTYFLEKDLDKLRNRDKNDWLQVFATANMKLKPCENPNPEGLEALILEITPKQPDVYTNEFEILEKIWLTWLNESSIPANIHIKDINLDLAKKNILLFLSSKNKISSVNRHSYQYFDLLKLKNPEIVKGYRGEYFLIDIYSSDKVRKKLFFEPGKYTISDFSKYSLALAEFGESIFSHIKGGEVDFQIFTLGSADFQGDKTFRGQLLSDFYYDRICFYPKFNDAKMYFSAKEKCIDMPNLFANKDLPLLRANFLKEKFDHFYSISMKPALILEGGVTLSVSDSERNGSLILYVNKIDFL